MTNKRFDNVWMRVAGHAQMIKQATPYRWRCYVNGDAPEINLRTWSVSGLVTPENMIAGTNPKGDANGIVAWIDFYGDFEIDESDTLHVRMKPAVGKAPAS